MPAFDLIAAPLLIIASYLAGAVPSGYAITRFIAGIDIREHGSGNPGAANVFRTVGARAGAATLGADILKGFLPVLLAKRFFPHLPAVIILCGAAAIAGHIWMIFLGSGGGKGVATTAGVFLALAPLPMAPTVLIFAGAVYTSGHISVGSIAGAAAFPLLSLAAGTTLPLALLAFSSCSLILIKHIPNLKKLVAEEGGNEKYQQSLEK